MEEMAHIKVPYASFGVVFYFDFVFEDSVIFANYSWIWDLPWNEVVTPSDTLL